MGKYYTATVVVPSELKSTSFLFVTNEPRLFDLRPLGGTRAGTIARTERHV